MDVRIGVLGPLLVERDGDPVTVPEGRRRAVLACLVARAGRPVPAEVLIDAAWGESLPVQPRSALHTVVSRLRSALGSETVVREPGGHRLAVRADAIDAHRFEDLCRRAASLPAAEAATCLGAALGLWRGRAFAEVSDVEVIASEARRLEQLRLDAQEQHAGALLSLGRYDEAVAVAGALLDEHPFREHAVALLMTALDRAGRTADALARYQTHRRTMLDELGLDPAPEVQKVEARILRRDEPAPSGPEPGRRDVGHRIEPPRWIDTSSRFVGRNAALAELLDAVESDRAVTVSGIAGVGKTRLAAEALPDLVARLHIPITVVELASVRPGQVGTALAGALDHPVGSDDVTRDVLEYLSIESRLLVLDNCEHVLGEVAGFVDAVLHRCPRVRVLATSRHRLGVRSEHVLPLAPLPTTDRSRDGTDRPAVDLFVDRMRRQRPAVELDAHDLDTVGEVCSRLDGIPLAIELAASRAATLGIGTVARELDREASPTGYLDAAVDWSIELLSPEQRRLLAHLSVVEGALRPTDAATIGQHLGWWDDDRGGRDDLEELVESNLLSAQGSESERTVTMLAVVRSVASRMLAGSGGEPQARRAHAAWVCTVCEDAARGWVAGRTAEAGRSLDRIAPDVEAALRWSLAQDDLAVPARIVGAIKACLHWQPRGALGDLVLEVARRCAQERTDGSSAVAVAAGALASAERGDLASTRDLAGAALGRAPDAATRFLAFLGLAVANLHAGDHEAAAAWLEEADGLDSIPLGHRVEAQITRGIVHHACGETDRARDAISVALVGAEVSGAEAARAFALYAAGEIDALEDPSAGVARLRQSAEAADRIGSSHVGHVARLALYALLVRADRHREALDLAVELLHTSRRSAAWPQVWTTLRISAELLERHDRLEDAALLLLAAEVSTSAPPLVGADVERYGRLRSRLDERLGPSVVQGLAALAASASRSAVVDRATTVLADLRGTVADDAA